MSRWRKRIDRIKAEIPIVRVLSDYGYAVRDGAEEREQQFSCDLHGDGNDTKPSGRVYPDSSSWFCFACSTARDAVATVQAKEGLDFKSAVTKLEAKYGLPTLPWDDDDEEEARAPVKPKLTDEVQALLHSDKPFAEDLKLLRAQLGWLTKDRELPMDPILRLWEASDAIAWMLEHGDITEASARGALAKVRLKLRDMQEPK
jgi:hypothetical protein